MTHNDVMKHFVIFDTEYTTWEGAADRDWTGPGEHREVVQIGASVGIFRFGKTA